AIYCSLLLSLFSSSSVDLTVLLSFPTRRSSDLAGFTFSGRLAALIVAFRGRYRVRFRYGSQRAPRRAPTIRLPETGSSEPCEAQDRKSTRLNSSHVKKSYAVFCLKKKTKNRRNM